MHRSRFLSIALGAIFLPAFGASASAATLSLSVAQVDSAEWNVAVSGQTEAPSQIFISVGKEAEPCAVNAYGATGGNPYARIVVPAGPFSQNADIRNSSGFDLSPKQRVCAYLEYTDRYQGPGDPSAAVAQAITGADPKVTFRANGNNVLDPFDGAVHELGAMSCGDTYYGQSEAHPCVVAGTGTITVSAKTRRKLKLPSAVIATGKAAKAGIGTYRMAFKATKAVRKRLKKAASVPAVVKVELTSPVARAFTYALTMRVARRTGARSVKPVYIRWTEGDAGNGITHPAGPRQ